MTQKKESMSNSNRHTVLYMRTARDEGINSDSMKCQQSLLQEQVAKHGLDILFGAFTSILMEKIPVDVTTEDEEEAA